MKELELTSITALTDAVYEVVPNGSFLDVKLEVGSVSDDDPHGLMPEIDHYHLVHPNHHDPILWEQPLDGGGDKIPVYELGKKVEGLGCCCHGTLTKGESRVATARKVVAHGPVWVFAAIAVGMDHEGSESPFMVAQSAGTFGTEENDENDMIGHAKKCLHRISALLVRRARLEGLKLTAIRVGYKYLFVEPKQIGKAKVKEG